MFSFLPHTRIVAIIQFPSFFARRHAAITTCIPDGKQAEAVSSPEESFQVWGHTSLDLGQHVRLPDPPDVMFFSAVLPQIPPV